MRCPTNAFARRLSTGCRPRSGIAKKPSARPRRLVVVPLYLDECFIEKSLARQLRAAGHLVYVVTELGLSAVDDDVQLAKATELGAVLVSQNQRHFEPLHHRWQAEGRSHAGILVTHQVRIGLKIQRLERAGRVLTPQLAQNQLMKLRLFETEDRAQLFVASLNR